MAERSRGCKRQHRRLRDRRRPVRRRRILAALNPDYILTATPGEAQAIMDSKEWAQTKAVKNKHVYTNPAGASPWGEPGAELLLQVQWAAAVIHPDLFKDFDEEQAVEDFYKEYFNYELDKDQVKLYPECRAAYRPEVTNAAINRRPVAKNVDRGPADTSWVVQRDGSGSMLAETGGLRLLAGQQWTR